MTAAKLECVEVLTIRLALRVPVETGAGTHADRTVLLVRVMADDGVGWGECGALAGGTVADPPLVRVREFLTGQGTARLGAAARASGGQVPDSSRVAGLFDDSAAGRMAGAVLEMAVLDLELRRSGRTLSDGLGAPGTPVSVGAMVGIPATRQLDELIREVGAAVSSGIARVRLKIEPGWDIEPVRALRSAFPDTMLQVDANGSYRLGGGGVADAARLADLDGLEIGCVEQPFPPGDLGPLRRLAELLETPICLDESLTTVRALHDAIQSGACEVACLKPARLGGLFAARRAQETCAEAGVPAFVGGLFETGLGRGANAALAGLAGFTLPGDLTDPGDYLDADPFGYPPVEAGTVRPRSTPGVGPPPDDSAITARTEAVVRWTP